MPVLKKDDAENASPVSCFAGDSGAFFPECGNSHCKNGWMRLWRSRRFPIFEGKWACCRDCLRQLVGAAVQREMRDRNDGPGSYQHRIPLGLMLLSQGHITQEQLRCALDAQKKAGSGRLGGWLVEQKAVAEERVVHALSAQWNCPVFSVERFDATRMASVLPRLLADSYSALPLRLAGRHFLYVAFEDRIDPCITYALERISGLKVQAGLIHDSEFRRAHRELLHTSFPKVRLLEATSLRGAVLAMTAMIEECKPKEARMVRVHNYFWLRLWRGTDVEGELDKPLPSADKVEDMVCSFSTTG